jgi:hypothetical protein
MKQQIDLGRVGVIATSLVDLFLSDSLRKMVNEMMSLGIAQALINHIASTESQLVIREISPYLDLVDGDYKQFESNQWIQKNNLHSLDKLDNARVPYSMRAVSMYRTDKNVANDQKVYIIYGLEFLNDYKGRNVEFIEFRKSNDKVLLRVPVDMQRPPLYKAVDVMNVLYPEETDKDIDIPVSFYGAKKLIYHNNMLLFKDPIMYRINDMMNIVFRYKQDVNYSQDEIKLKGFVVENIGRTIY